MADPDRAAAQAIARKLREAGDPDVTAVEIVVLIKSLGWRRTNLLPAPPWKPHRSGGSGPTPGYLAARAQLDEHLTKDART